MNASNLKLLANNKYSDAKLRTAPFSLSSKMMCTRSASATSTLQVHPEALIKTITLKVGDDAPRWQCRVLLGCISTEASLLDAHALHHGIARHLHMYRFGAVDAISPLLREIGMQTPQRRQ
jgi:hypothetical protein